MSNLSCRACGHRVEFERDCALPRSCAKCGNEQFLVDMTQAAQKQPPLAACMRVHEAVTGFPDENAVRAVIREYRAQGCPDID